MKETIGKRNTKRGIERVISVFVISKEVLKKNTPFVFYFRIMSRRDLLACFLSFFLFTISILKTKIVVLCFN